MAQFGLKIGIHEAGLVRAAAKLWQMRQFDFLELYINPAAMEKDADHWDWYDGPTVLHAPHAMDGFNFSQREKEEDNFRSLALLDALRKRLSPLTMVFHPGLNGDPGESLRQIERVRKEYPGIHQILLLENKPRLGLHGECCLGASPREMQHLLESSACGFCLDVRHAIAYAAWANENWEAVLDAFTDLRPRLWHVADGKVNDMVDSHDHIGDGDIAWRTIGLRWSGATLVTIECKKNPDAQLEDFLKDVNNLLNQTRLAREL